MVRSGSGLVMREIVESRDGCRPEDMGSVQAGN